MISHTMASYVDQGPLDGQVAAGDEDEEMDEGIDLFGLAAVLIQDRRIIAAVTLMSLFFGLLISLMIKPVFTATALILPPQQQQSSVSAMMGQLGSLIGGGSGLSVKNPGDLYVGILRSRTVADQIIAKFQLQSLYRKKTMEETRAELNKHVQFVAGKDGLIQLAASDHSPQRASDMANAYIDALYSMNSNLAISEAAQRRVFFDRQLNEEKEALAAAETDLKATQERTGLIQLSGQAESIIRSIADLRAQISSREVEMEAMRTFATDQNPDLTRIQQEIATLRQQLSLLENDQQRLQPGDTEVPAGRVPKDALEYARKAREVRYHESLLELLTRQYEAARIDEAKSAPVIQVVDRAIPPDKKSGPHRLTITLGTTLLGFCAACGWALLRHGVRKMSEDPENALKLQGLRDSLHG